LKRAYHGNDSILIAKNFTIGDISGHSDVKRDEHREGLMMGFRERVTRTG
jgi:hypothetical protein